MPIYHVRCQGPQQGKSTCSHLKGLCLTQCHTAPELPEGLLRASPACNTSRVRASHAADRPRARTPSPKGAVPPQGQGEDWGRARSNTLSHSSEKNPSLVSTAACNPATRSAVPCLLAAAPAPRWHGPPPSGSPCSRHSLPPGPGAGVLGGAAAPSAFGPTLPRVTAVPGSDDASVCGRPPCAAVTL